MRLCHVVLGRGYPAKGFMESFMVVAVHPFLGHVIENNKVRRRGGAYCDFVACMKLTNSELENIHAQTDSSCHYLFTPDVI